MAVNFGNSERMILGLFRRGSVFTHDRIQFTVVQSGKPTCFKGEPKTDIYIEAVSEDSQHHLEFKISFKQRNADFLENKTSAERAEQLLGTEWSDIIADSTESIAQRFAERPLIYTRKFGRVDKGAITLGWKFEIMNKPGGDLSGRMQLSRDEMIDVYAGTTLAGDKRNAMLNGRMVIDSGIATHILFDDVFPYDIQDAVDALISIDDYVDAYPDMYFACKALNYRTEQHKYDGNRPLSVYVNWYVENNQLVSELVFSEPLIRGGDYAFANLISSLRRLGITSVGQMSSRNVYDFNRISI